MFRTICLAALFAVLLSGKAGAVNLVVEVTGVRSSAGDVRLTLFAEGDFLDFKKVLCRVATPARAGHVRLRLNDLPPGRYSFSIAHDENRNGIADRNLLGIPIEGVAVSNNARGLLGPPAEATATFVLAAPTVKQSVSLIYF